ncbi:MFS transporter [Campylobacter canadensis]|uniref:MFS transporter n=1 Tax=Campylobacter canadensis TaxID=449520 RepID=A0ABS7WRW7_9BACT|nr:MFS transporter [Campylobacter canadensis]MBZ7987495.1 MFS transporter [Campylobacter canadensis]MBZ7994838.1 MFS transporter [Campylobacter canadensis]MBZ7996377.1 MFS transporter [Campylobacter canadensis]MBZ7998411.1 MFS transporter [Campylobacter canadensis]MBZ8000125.1 MFS transporter [Campylobacter canadensis]
MKKKYFILSILCVIFISLNLRAPITTIGPIVNELIKEFNLTNTQIGILSSIPLFCFFIFSLIAPLFQAIKSIFIALFILALGLLLRIAYDVNTLMLGSVFIGIAIAILNVLMPSFIKSKFKDSTKIMPLYGLFLSISSLIGVFGYYLLTLIKVKGVLVFWIIFTIAAFIVFLPFIKNNRLKRKYDKKQNSNFLSIFKNKKAWIITLFMGLQSCVFYTVISFYPSILEYKLHSSQYATLLTLIFQFVALFSAYYVPLFANKSKNQSLFLSLVCFCNIIAFTLCLFSSNLFLLGLSAILFSIPVGGIFAVALSMIASKTKDVQSTIYLSSMAQSFGYLIAAIGPIIFGYLKDLSSNFNLSIIFMLIISTLLLIFSKLSSKISFI